MFLFIYLDIITSHIKVTDVTEMILFYIFVLALVGQSKENIVFQDSECEEKDGFLVDNFCYVPIFNVSLNYNEAVKECVHRGLSLARITSPGEDFFEFIREKMKPNFLSVFWVDGLLTVSFINVYLLYF